MTPYATLTPDCMLDAIESVGVQCDGRLLALNSYENRVYQVGIEDSTPLIAKFYRPARWSDAAILEEHRFAEELATDEIPVVAPIVIAGHTLHHAQGFRFALFPRRGGRAPELSDPAVLEWIGRFLGRLHAVGKRTRFGERSTLSIASLGHASRDFLLAHDGLPRDLHAAYSSVLEHALAGVEHCFTRAGTVATLRLHGDCHAGNILWTDDGPHFVDLDDCCNGPAVQDLWMLLAGERAEMTQQLSDILAGYEDFNDFNRRELHLIEALRTLRQIHYAAWLARRRDDPAFPAAFPWFNTQHYWQNHILALREQIALMDEAPLVV